MVDEIQLDQIERFKTFVASTLEEMQYAALPDASMCQALPPMETQDEPQEEKTNEFQAKA